MKDDIKMINHLFTAKYEGEGKKAVEADYQEEEDSRNESSQSAPEELQAEKSLLLFRETLSDFDLFKKAGLFCWCSNDRSSIRSGSSVT